MTGYFYGIMLVLCLGVALVVTDGDRAVLAVFVAACAALVLSSLMSWYMYVVQQRQQPKEGSLK